MKVLMEENPSRPTGKSIEKYSKFLVSKGAILDIKNNKNENCYSIIEKMSFDKKDNLKNLEKIKVIRSTELMYIAYKKGLIDVADKRVLEAILFALKYGGCSISEKEIQIIKNLWKQDLKHQFLS